jgi:hypothetical protein
MQAAKPAARRLGMGLEAERLVELRAFGRGGKHGQLTLTLEPARFSVYVVWG